VGDPLAQPEAMIRRVYAYVAYRIGDGPDAEDVTSEVFVRALRYRASYDPAKGQPITWLTGIARTVLIENGQAPQTLGEDALPALVEPSQEERTDERLALTDALAHLSERDRELLALRYGADLKAKQIAALADMDTHAVEVALSRALARLREIVGDDL
jgi:RNA polymerase sigma factor (sigma-70 family)